MKRKSARKAREANPQQAFEPKAKPSQQEWQVIKSSGKKRQATSTALPKDKYFGISKNEFDVLCGNLPGDVVQSKEELEEVVEPPKSFPPINDLHGKPPSKETPTKQSLSLAEFPPLSTPSKTNRATNSSKAQPSPLKEASIRPANLEANKKEEEVSSPNAKETASVKHVNMQTQGSDKMQLY